MIYVNYTYKIECNLKRITIKNKHKKVQELKRNRYQVQIRRYKTKTDIRGEVILLFYQNSAINSLNIGKSKIELNRCDSSEIDKIVKTVKKRKSCLEFFSSKMFTKFFSEAFNSSIDLPIELRKNLVWNLCNID